MDCTISFNFNPIIDPCYKPIIDPCYKCKNKLSCKNIKKFSDFGQSCGRAIIDSKLLGFDPIEQIKIMVESHKDELICENFIDDESIQKQTFLGKQSFLGILELQNKNN